MRRSSVLNAVIQECKKQGVTGPLGELIVWPTDDSVRAKRRSIFIVGSGGEHDIRFAAEQCETVLSANGNPTYRATHHFHGTIENPIFSDDPISLSDTKLENNWRSRLVRLNQIDFANREQVYKLVLSATWRLVVTMRNNEFFVRHDIYPVIWSPGFSVGGTQDLGSAIGHEMDFFGNRSSRLFDEHSDILKVFAGEAGGVFNELTVGGHQQLRINEIQNAPGNFRDEVLAALRGNFHIA